MKTKIDFKFELLYGSAIGFVTILWLLAEQYLGLTNASPTVDQILGLVVVLIPVIGISIGLRMKKKAQKGQITFWEATWAGVIMAAIAGLITGLFMLIYLTAVPAVTDSYIEYVRTSMTAGGQTATEVNEAIDFLRKQLSPLNQGINALLGSIIMGMIISMIVAAFIKNKPGQK